MADVNFSGTGSGIDFNTIRDAILTQRSRPVTLLQSKANNYNNRIEALKQLNTALATLTTAAENLTKRDLGSGRSTTTGDANVVTATATSAANLGSYDISVARLATNLTQASRSFPATTAAILAGGATAATFELRKGGAAEGVSITIDSSNNTLAGLRDAINAKNAGVTAAIVDVNGDGTGHQLVLTSKETGASGRVELVETSATGTLADLNLRGVNPPDGDPAKLDASFSINGLSVTRSSNTISDALEGVTLNLRKTGAATVGVTQSTEIENKLRSFINAYNAVQDFVGNQYKKDSSNRPTGILAGDTTLRAIQQQIRSVVGGVSSGNGGVFENLTQIGITTKDDGQLTLDSTVFNEKLKSSPEDVKALLFGRAEGQKGIFQNFLEMSKGFSDSVTGTVQTAISGYQNSVKSLNASISQRLESLNRLKDSLTRQFAAADAAIGQLNGQGTALTNIIKSLDSNRD
jgi:flagellar hook-associated protein 2